MQDVFAASGVAMKKLLVVPEPIDTAFFDPAKASPLQLPQGDLVFGTQPSSDAEVDYAFISVRQTSGQAMVIVSNNSNRMLQMPAESWSRTTSVDNVTVHC